MRYESPQTVEAAVALLAQEAGLARILAGGTDLLVQLRSGLVEPDLVVDIKRIPEMRRIAAESGGFRIPGRWQEGAGGRHPNFRVDVVPEGAVWCGKAGHRDGRFVAVRFEGVLEVTDPTAFCKTVENGIGSGKGFGFGLLSVAPLGG